MYTKCPILKYLQILYFFNEAGFNFWEEVNANESSGKYFIFHMSFCPADFALGIKAFSMAGKSENKFLIKFSEEMHFLLC